ncbi:MAG: type II secretion system protein [Actinobacteria bacterium]|jgi:prepilin-type N-terminal cleavage/methylation domain-containing protein|nr:MAG: type II secretion system protein [Actinomycetota bacterium]
MHKARVLEKQGGFTLVELMVVVGIIGILVSIAVISFAFSVSASKKTACRANLKTIRDQIVVYYSRYHAYPPSLQDLVPEYIEKDSSLNCPDSGEAYDYDPGTGEVSCPFHTGI